MERVGEVENSIKGISYQLSDGNWKSVIFDGWWVAIRVTKEQSQKAVIKLYRQEIEKLENG